jgi:hypothetical protein
MKWRMSKEEVALYFEVLSQDLPGRTVQIYKKPQSGEAISMP